MALKFLLALILMFNPALQLDGMAAKKFPGEPTNFSWTFPVGSEANISGFRLYSSPSATGPFSVLVSSTPKTNRSLTAPASFSPGTGATFYVIRTFLTLSSGEVESVESNSVEVELNVPGATDLQVN